jgi:hypothetical protein
MSGASAGFVLLAAASAFTATSDDVPYEVVEERVV